MTTGISESVNTKPVFLYVMGGGGRQVKIGFSSHPDKRRAALQASTTEEIRLLAFALIAPGKQASVQEHEAHHMLNRRRVRGEWFDVDRWTATTVIEYCANGDHGWKVAQAAADLASTRDDAEADRLRRFLTAAQWRYLSKAIWSEGDDRESRKRFTKRAAMEEWMDNWIEHEKTKRAARAAVERLRG